MKMALKLMTVMIILAIGFWAFQTIFNEKPLKTDKDKMSYGLGALMGGNYKRMGIPIDIDILLKGVRDAYEDAPLLLTEKEQERVTRMYYAEMRRRAPAAKVKRGELEN
jgi:FKBP-type peptidyl-prolyl cis-trans isomerase FklB